MEQIFASWWSMVSAFVSAPLGLADGNVSVFAVLPVVSALLLVAGVVLALAWREKRGLLLIPIFVVAAFAPAALGIAHDMAGWFGMLFALIIGAVALLVWIGVVAGDATRRLPVVLTGLSFVGFVVFCGMYSIALVWG